MPTPKLNDKNWKISTSIDKVFFGDPYRVYCVGEHVDGHLMHVTPNNPNYRTRSKAVKALAEFKATLVEKINSGVAPTYIKKS